VLISFIGYIAVYLLIFPAGFLVMRRIVRRGPVALAETDTLSGRGDAIVRGLPERILPEAQS
jgi:cytochrome d ubiquinol oxidase subunit I